MRSGDRLSGKDRSRGRDIYTLYREIASMRVVIIMMIALAAFFALPAMGETVDYWYDQANVYFISGDYESAVSSYEKAIELMPNSTVLWNYKGRALANLGRIDEAIVCFDESISINSSNPEAISLKAIALSQGQQKYLEAILLFDRALALNPEYFDAWNGKGMALANQGDLSASLQCLVRATEVKPTDPVGWNNRGVVLREMQNYQAALDCFNRAILIDPGYETAMQNREYTLQDMDQATSGVPDVTTVSGVSQSTMTMD